MCVRIDTRIIFRPGDTVGLLVSRSQQTLTVWVNGQEQPVVAYLPRNAEPLHFAVEMIADPQVITVFAERGRLE